MDDVARMLYRDLIDWWLGVFGAGSVVDGSGVECVGIIDRSGGSELNSGGRIKE